VSDREACLIAEVLMHAVVIEGGELVWQRRPDPQPALSELLVAVRAAGVNGADLAQLRGGYPAPPGSPADIPGLELAGAVVEVGERVKRFAAGDRVMALVGGGAQAELAVVEEAHTLAVPAGVSWTEAGGFPEAYFTAFDALFGQGSLALGERVLITGAAGGVGTAAVQLAAAAGAHVVASVRDPSLRAAVAALGALEVVDWADIAYHGPYDVVLELVGASSLALSLPVLSIGGRAVVIGTGGGARLDLDLVQVMRLRARLSGSTLRSRSTAEKAALTAAIEHRVLPLLEAGRLRLPVSAAFTLSDARRAYARFAAPGKLGKIVLTHSQ
jgi:NADPH:quinone reductase-like Zn-dependent oxidoreductase